MSLNPRLSLDTALQYSSSFFRRPVSRIVTFSLVFIGFIYLFFPGLSFSYFPEDPNFSHHRHRPYDRPSRPDFIARPWSHHHGKLVGPGWTSPPRKAGALDAWASRAKEVKGAFVDAYSAYKAQAAWHDELLPLSNKPVDNFNGWGLTVVESLDTMWLMGLYDEFNDALSVVANISFALPDTKYAPFFETVIRYLGGLLSAYSLSNDPIFLARADELGEMLLPAFNTPSGLPMYAVNTVSGKTQGSWSPGMTLWAEALSCQVEYKYLAYLTGRKEYYTKVERLMEMMHKVDVSKTADLFPTKWDTMRGTPKNLQLSVGAYADSAYEYMLKQWLLTGRTDTKARDLYIKSANAIISTLLYITPTRNLLYVTDTDGASLMPSHTFEHLSCFLPALLALGARTLPLSPTEHERHMWAAKGLGQTCYLLYADAATGLAPDEVQMVSWSSANVTGSGRWVDHLREWEDAGREGGIPPGVRHVKSERGGEPLREYRARKTGWLLRPEAVESFYVLWRVTRDPRWRERGLEVFLALQREARIDGGAGGYASVEDVYTVGAGKRNEMPSYFLAETLKYLYLLFTDEELVPLDRWVFNTEAHPLPVFEWSEWEVARYGIT
ncbi:hypothetical protein EW146_g8290 [Bondarzewia mesenterica]|uniref:alpha-1,2-Mannosidase n=1 Tax=Bondarzewia mesenterica TaxID=1095465 RepID=A0A4S4LL55_9AGAM|nr:hypothetical protein EW146_g8290 [Bondarzewia mesenterica]